MPYPDPNDDAERQCEANTKTKTSEENFLPEWHGELLLRSQAEGNNRKPYRMNAELKRSRLPESDCGTLITTASVPDARKTTSNRLMASRWKDSLRPSRLRLVLIKTELSAQ